MEVVEHVLSATEARVRFGELLRRVTEQHETVVVERGGVPQAVVMSMAEYQRLSVKQTPGGWRSLARMAHDEAMKELRGRPVHRPEDMLEQARKERDGRLTSLR